MELEQLRESMKICLSSSRYLHSIGVEEVSYDLALIYGCDTEIASIAGILHDCAKCIKIEILREECITHHLSITETENESTQLLHAKVGAIYAREKYGIHNREILDAITYHTTGRPAMTLLEKIIFTADYIEPYRAPLPNIDVIRKMAYEDLNTAVYMVLENTLDYLKNTGTAIDTITNMAYQYYKNIACQST